MKFRLTYLEDVQNMVKVAVHEHKKIEIETKYKDYPRDKDIDYFSVDIKDNIETE